MLSQQMLVSILLVSVDRREISRSVAALALVPLCGDLKAENLLNPFLLMWVFKKLNLS